LIPASSLGLLLAAGSTWRVSATLLLLLLLWPLLLW
jgi:hypothetical protein